MSKESDTRRLELFLKFVSDCARIREHVALLRLLAQRARCLLEFERLTILICDEDCEILRTSVIEDCRLREASADDIQLSEMELILQALTTGEAANGSAGMCIPLVSGGRTMGAMCYASRSEQYTDQDLDLARFLADCLAGTFERLEQVSVSRNPMEAVMAAVDALETSISATQAVAVRMSYLAQHDQLTDLPNRWLLNERLTRAVRLSKRYQRRLAVLFMDLDRFKHINDSLGHAIGDQVLCEISHRMVGCVRTSDTVSRIGGDEFVVLLAELVGEKDAIVCADKIIAAVAAPMIIDHHELRLTVSIGITMYPNDGEDAETLIRNADIAMYHSKAEGCGKRHLFRKHMNVAAYERRMPEIA